MPSLPCPPACLAYLPCPALPGLPAWRTLPACPSLPGLNYSVCMACLPVWLACVHCLLLAWLT